ncbi:MAG: hypothetical protein KGL63_11415 [Betaproteobacteria bacterium]|nr:hypothetical protein [Betaproteobacteria bacterium]
MPELLLPFCIPLAWSRCRTRSAAGLWVLALYLAGAREEPFAVARVMSGWGLKGGFLVWVLHALSLALPWVAGWIAPEGNARRRQIHLLAILALQALPPFGFWGWLHPFTLGGWLFPGWGPWGLAAVTGTLLALAGDNRRLLLFAALLSATANLNHVMPRTPAGWLAVDTNLPRMEADVGSRFERQQHLMALLQQTLDEYGKSGVPARVLVLPEEIAGPWTAAEAWWWQPLVNQLHRLNITLVLGAQQPTSQGLRNGALLFTPMGEFWQLARQPIPLAEWRFWEGPPSGWRTGITGLPWSNGLVQIQGRRVLLSFCFEDLLALPVLATMGLSQRPEILVSMANLWWAGGLNEPEVQRLTVEGWARLWGIPLVRAENQARQEACCTTQEAMAESSGADSPMAGVTWMRNPE